MKVFNPFFGMQHCLSPRQHSEIGAEREIGTLVADISGYGLNYPLTATRSKDQTMISKKTALLAIFLTTGWSACAIASGSSSHSNGSDDSSAHHQGLDDSAEHQALDDDLHRNHGMSVTHHADGHLEINDTHGNRYSYRLTSQQTTGAGCADGRPVCYSASSDDSQSMSVSYSSGKSSTAHGESHSGTEVSEHAARLGYVVVSSANGLVTVRHASNATTLKIRFGARLTQGAAGIASGIRMESDGRIVVRYSDSVEQEIVIVP